MIREGSVADIDAVMSVMRDAFDPAFGEAWTEAQTTALLVLPGAGLWVADGGFAITRTVIDECELMLIAVRRDRRGQGIGTALLTQVIAAARRAGAGSMFLEMRSDNPARALYEGAGFRTVGRRRDYYRGSDGTRRDAETFRLTLA